MADVQQRRSRSSSRASLFLLACVQMVIPADPQEMSQFQAQCVAQCQCAVDISLPLAYILLPSKQAFQSVYNRSTTMFSSLNAPLS